MNKNNCAETNDFIITRKAHLFDNFSCFDSLSFAKSSNLTIWRMEEQEVMYNK